MEPGGVKVDPSRQDCGVKDNARPDGSSQESGRPHDLGHSGLLTEQRNPRSYGLDRMSTLEMLQVINDEDRKVPQAVGEAIPAIEKAVNLVVEKLKTGGTLYYIGAGTSGRLGILDAAESLPTFGAGPEMVSALIAGGSPAVFRPVEESEDHEENGAREIAERVSDRDVVVGISASGVTPYVRGGLRAAREAGAGTVAIICNNFVPQELGVDVVIPLMVGPEVVTGSTRMKAGTAQKLVLNMISTASMVSLGKVYENLMVDMRPTNRKLRARAVRIVAAATGVDETLAAEVLDRAEGSIKTAVVMQLAGLDRVAALNALDEAGGHVRVAIARARGEMAL
jgi:N-acetylmuramic acid 6-phosphate etherase